MNSVIKKELDQVIVTDLHYDDTTSSIFIPKTTHIAYKALESGKCYEVQFGEDCCIIEVIDNSCDSTLMEGVIIKQGKVQDLHGWHKHSEFTILSRK